MNVKANGSRKRVLTGAAIVAAIGMLAGTGALIEGSASAATPTPPVIKVGFKNGPVTVSGTAYKTVATMSLAAGSYDLFGKAWVHDGGVASEVTCRLVAGGDYDSTMAAVEAGAATADNETVALNVAHTFGSAGSVRMDCRAVGGGVSINYIKISAIQAGTLTNVQMP